MRPYPYIMDLSKTIQAMAHLLKQTKYKRYGLIGILKVLYRADVKSLKETAYPLLRAGDELVDIANSRYEPNNASWQKYMYRIEVEPESKTELVLIKDPGVGKLCPYELDLLENIFREVDRKNDL